MKKIQMFIKDQSFPCLKEELIGTASQNGADRSVIGTLETVPIEFITDPQELMEYL